MSPGRDFYADTATIEECREVIAGLVERLAWANGEHAADLEASLEEWRRALMEKVEGEAPAPPSR